MGPTGKFLRPQGEYTEEQFEAAYEAQACGLASGGVDFLLIETQYDLKEAMCALRASKRAAPRIPVFVTMTFTRTPRGFYTIMGDDFRKFSTAAAAAGASAVGANCTLGSREMAELAVEMGKTAKLPIIAQANAGQPEARPDGSVSYSQTPEDFVSSVPSMLEAGVVLLGGCCGTGPAHIRKMADIVKPD
jgi:5-methyltetrahydrofolate--homocysteine methyltransferase